ncbi:MAG: HEPN domain-containing protein [Cyanobium sp.]
MADRASHGHHEWACFAAHQAVEKALKGLHLSLGQQIWGHGLGRLFRSLPDPLHILTRYPDNLPDGAPADHFGQLQSREALSHARTLVEAIAAALA